MVFLKIVLEKVIKFRSDLFWSGGFFRKMKFIEKNGVF